MMLRLRKFFIVIVWSHMKEDKLGELSTKLSVDVLAVVKELEKDLLYTIDLPLSDRHVKLS